MQTFISVGEPWNFKSPDGDNIINGLITTFLSPKRLLFRANYVLYFGDLHGDVFVLTPRYTGETFDELSNAMYVPVNGSILSNTVDYAHEAGVETHSKFV